MKRGLVIHDQALTARGLCPGEDYEYVNNVHDEYQLEVTKDSPYDTDSEPMLCDVVGEAGVKAIQDAGTYYNMQIPLDAEYKVGLNWSETH